MAIRLLHRRPGVQIPLRPPVFDQVESLKSFILLFSISSEASELFFFQNLQTVALLLNLEILRVQKIAFSPVRTFHPLTSGSV